MTGFASSPDRRPRTPACGSPAVRLPARGCAGAAGLPCGTRARAAGLAAPAAERPGVSVRGCSVAFGLPRAGALAPCGAAAPVAGRRSGPALAVVQAAVTTSRTAPKEAAILSIAGPGFRRHEAEYTGRRDRDSGSSASRAAGFRIHCGASRNAPDLGARLGSAGGQAVPAPGFNGGSEDERPPGARRPLAS